jgi:SAM-dependent methyltransferase
LGLELGPTESAAWQMSDSARECRETLSKRYSDTAQGYKDLWAPELVPLSVEVLPFLSLGRARAVLDAGAGVGSLLPRVKGLAREALVVACDLSFGMLTIAPNEFPRAVMDVSTLAFKDESFDAAILAFVLFHLFDPTDGVAEMERVLRPHGRIGTVTWGDELDSPAYEIWFEELNAHGAPPADPGLAQHELVDTPDKVEAMMRMSGLHPLRSWIGGYRATNTVDEFLAHRTRHGQSRHRLEAMPAEVRASCLEGARRRLVRLAPEDFEERAEVVYVVAEKK